MCFFSIIIPSYNRANVLSSTISSVLSNDFRDFEIILIDDGSNDNTFEVISSIKDERLKYFYQHNQDNYLLKLFWQHQKLKRI